jgi:hypothetical protein
VTSAPDTSVTRDTDRGLAISARPRTSAAGRHGVTCTWWRSAICGRSGGRTDGYHGFYVYHIVFIAPDANSNRAIETPSEALFADRDGSAEDHFNIPPWVRIFDKATPRRAKMSPLGLPLGLGSGARTSEICPRLRQECMVGKAEVSIVFMEGN